MLFMYILVVKKQKNILKTTIVSDFPHIID